MLSYNLLMNLYWVNPSKRAGTDGFLTAGRAAPRDFPRIARGKSRGAALLAQGNPVLPDSFIQIYIIFIIGFLF